jgi:hypothetical protein|tara:strand:- start:3050 stop:3559 length:510 start_codon:yes stop_codon:yes gene_type:complete
MGKKVYVECSVNWAKLQESDRDMGKNMPEGSDARAKIEEVQGRYTVQLMLDEDSKKKMVEDGVPNKGMQAQLFKEDQDGNEYFSARKGHFNPKFKDEVTGEYGVTMGPPRVRKTNEDGVIVPWDFNEDGLIGNGSRVIALLDVWDGKLTTLEAIKVVEHVAYEADGSDF